MSFTAPMSGRRRLLVVAVGVGLVLFGAVSVWRDGATAPRHARILLLDPRTGKTLHEQVMNAGYAVVALLRGGRVAVATMDSCVNGDGGSVAVLDPTLERVVHHESMAPCAVARIDAAGVRRFLGEEPGPAPRSNAAGLIFKLVRGTIRESISPQSHNYSVLSARDTTGRELWRRTSFDGPLGAVSVLDNRIAVAILGTFTPGSD